jgi:hypothetical protein
VKFPTWILIFELDYRRSYHQFNLNMLPVGGGLKGGKSRLWQNGTDRGGAQGSGELPNPGFVLQEEHEAFLEKGMQKEVGSASWNFCRFTL